MAGTDKSQAQAGKSGPAVILVDPQMGENIGAAARAMLNCGLTDLRVVRPRDGWPNERAVAMSAGALDRMPPVQVFDDTASALADCHYVYATTARPRDMVKPVINAREAAADMKRRMEDSQQTGILFGAERAGLANDDISLAHAIVTIPLNPGFSSLNLAQGVLLVAYEWYQQYVTLEQKERTGENLPAAHEKLNELYDRLEDELEKNHFFRSPDMRPSMMRNLKNMLGRAEMTEQEARTFHGVISALTGKKSPLPDKD